MAALVPAMRQRAARHDAEASAPLDDLASLREAGLLRPRAGPLRDLLILLGRGHLAVGRLVEAHVNALQLIAHYASPRQRAASEADARGGHLFGLWVTDDRDAPLVRARNVLAGAKSPCSGVGAATRALVTVQTEAGSVMAVLPTDRLVSEPLPPASGMRAGVQGRVRFDGAACPDHALIGEPGDYLREPDLSCGAWRTCAVTLGGLDHLVELLRDHLLYRHHHHAPLQQERFGLALIAQQTARMWVDHAARQAEDESLPTADRVAAVNLARIAIEAACLDAIRLVQRSAGLAAVLPGPMERVVRDLSTYLRQPAPDAVLTEAAARVLAGP